MVDGGDHEGAASAPGAEWIKLVKNIELTAKVAVVHGKTAAKTHPTEVSRLHHDHLIVIRAAGNKLFRFTEFRYNTCPKISRYNVTRVYMSAACCQLELLNLKKFHSSKN